jgi:molybdopterin-guanine dinucleotide biosynthesis protein A
MPNSLHPDTRLGAIVLCGGKSTRLGIDKTQLIFQGQTFLERVVSQVQKVCHPVILVGDADFSQHQLPPNVQWATDENADCGPLEGIRVGLAKLASQVDMAFVTSCDVPLIDPELIRFLSHRISDRDAVIPVSGERVFGMTAVYRTKLHGMIHERIQNGQLRVSELATAFPSHQIHVDSLREIDPELDSMTNINSAVDYFDLLKRFGLELSPELQNRFKNRN